MPINRREGLKVLRLFLVAGTFLFLVGFGLESAESKAVPAKEPAKPAVREAGDKEVIGRAKHAVDRGIRYLSKNRNKDGSYGERPGVGITGLCVRAMAESHRKYR